MKLKSIFTDGAMWLKAFLAFAAILLCFFLGISQLTPPSPVTKNVPVEKFSAERAFLHLEQIAKVAHPNGSEANDAVRGYILEQINKMGLEPVIQEASVKKDEEVKLTIHNIMVRVKGTASSGVIVVMQHYDSVRSGPGANDDGTAVAAALDSLHSITELPKLKNDLIFLFTDAEELGLWGARKFAEFHPWFRDASMVLNYEARGYKGPSLMFETSEENGWVIPHYAAAAPYPRAYSWAFEVYKRLPNNTDFTVFKRSGITGLNFAYIGGMVYYHSKMDNLQNVNRSGFQHHGENMLPLLMHFGNIDLKNTKAGNRIYFSVFDKLVHYPATMAIPLMIVFGLLLLSVLFKGIRKQQLKITRIIAGFFLMILVLVVTSLVIYLAWQMISGITNPEYEAQALYTRYQAETETGKYMLAFSSITAALFSLGYFLFFKRIREQDLFSGVLLLFFVLALITSAIAPGGSYLFVFPLVFGTLALALKLKNADLESWRFSWKTTLAIWLTGLPSALIMAPNIALLTDAMGLKMFFALGNLFLVLLLGLMLFNLRVILEKLKWYFPTVLMVIGIVILMS
jgi:hypothetical protein